MLKDFEFDTTYDVYSMLIMSIIMCYYSIVNNIKTITM